MYDNQHLVGFCSIDSCIFSMLVSIKYEHFNRKDRRKERKRSLEAVLLYEAGKLGKGT